MKEVLEVGPSTTGWFGPAQHPAPRAITKNWVRKDLPARAIAKSQRRRHLRDMKVSDEILAAARMAAVMNVDRCHVLHLGAHPYSVGTRLDAWGEHFVIIGFLNHGAAVICYPDVWTCE